MQLGSWYFKKPYPDRKISITEGCESLIVSFRDNQYTVLNCLLDITGLTPLH